MKIRLTESQLKRLVSEAIKNTLSEAEVFPGLKSDVVGNSYDDNHTQNFAVKNRTDSINDQVPDFVSMWADRLEKQLNRQAVEMGFRQNMFTVLAKLNDESTTDNGLMMKGRKFVAHTVIFTVHTAKYLRGSMPGNQSVKMISNTAYKLFGNLEGAELSFGTSRGGDFVVYLTFRDYFGTNGKSETSRLFKNNPRRQIGSNPNYLGVDDIRNQ